MNRIIEDKELGRLVVKVNSRARRLIFRPKDDAIYVTVPPYTSIKEIEDAIHKLRGKLIVSRQKVLDRSVLIDLNYRIDTDFFKLSLEEGRHEKFLASGEPGKMRITCPPGTDFSDERVQKWLRKVVEEMLRRHAKALLPPRIRMLSDKHNIPFQQVKINSSRGRWGSCSAKKGINLSCYLLTLPTRLIDYVLLHELCHTREMNHSERFWALLDSLSGGKSAELRQELKMYKTDL